MFDFSSINEVTTGFDSLDYETSETYSKIVIKVLKEKDESIYWIRFFLFIFYVIIFKKNTMVIL